MAQHADFESDVIFNALALRSTAEQISTVSNCTGYIPKTILIENGLNQVVTFQAEGSREESFAKPITIGAPFDVAAATNTYQTLSDYFPFLRVKAICAVAPASGVLTVSLEKLY